MLKPCSLLWQPTLSCVKLMGLKNKQSSEQVWVEGPNDLYVTAGLWEAVKQQNPLDRFFLRKADGYKQLLKLLPTVLTPDNPGPVGLIVDADEDFASRWQSLTYRLSEIGYQIPSNMEASGLILQQKDLPRLGVWIWPDNGSSGLLEDFLRVLIPANDKLLDLAEKTLMHINAEGWQRFSDPKKPKALIHTWLAWQANPGPPFGQAIKSRYLQATHPLAQRFIDWLDRLFEHSSR